MKKQESKKNIELVDKLIEIKLAISEVQEENRTLKMQLEQQNQIVRHNDGNYITLTDDPLKIQYCSTCWGNDKKLIQLKEKTEVREGLPRCPICFNNWLSARNSGQ